ncbi:MAG TPA: hypothetical protein ENK43_01710 [Planctomycetes bacterium]|nr:hypothetical protein [Planctomycetota bacterium]
MHVKLILGMFILLLGVASAQQVEVNDAGGSLTSGGQDPVPGQPFLRTVNGSIDFTVGGGPSLPFALMAGPLAPTSFTDPLLSGEWYDLQPLSAILLVDGFGGGGMLPSFISQLNGFGEASFVFPLSTAANGVEIAFQSIVQDPTISPLFLNFTAAADFLVTTAVAVTGDDVVMNYSIPSGPLTLLGQTYGTLSVSTNGWIQFGGGAVFADPTESTGEFVTGTPGGAPAGPIVAVLWEDLDVGNGPTQAMIVEELMPAMIRVTWQNADYFPSTPAGTLRCTLDFTGTEPHFLMDYTGYQAATPPFEGLVGLSLGGGGGTALDLVVGGVVQSTAPTGAQGLAVFQNFDGSGVPAVAPEAFDLAGLILDFQISAAGFVSLL